MILFYLHFLLLMLLMSYNDKERITQDVSSRLHKILNCHLIAFYMLRETATLACLPLLPRRLRIQSRFVEVPPDEIDHHLWAL